MSQIDQTTVDIDDVIARVQAVRRGELPESSVSIEELRAAIEAQRQRFTQGAAAPSTDSDGNPAPAKRVKKASALVIPNINLGDVGL